MKRAIIITVALAGGAVLALPLLAIAQPNEAEQKSFFLNFVQDRLSTPERRIAISNIDGALSSDASIREITVSDAEGVYLKIEDIALNWNQAALFTGRLEVNSLTAQSIDYLRNPVAAKSEVALPAPEAGGIEVPQLPVAVVVKQLSVPRISFGAGVFGLGSEISLDGSITLEGGSLDSNLAVKRLDGPGGALDLKAKYDKPTTELDLDLGLTEPKDGIIANLLDIEGRPDIRLAVTGAGPVSALKTQLTLDAGGTRALTGTADVTRAVTGFAVDPRLNGPIATLVAPSYRAFFGAETALNAKGMLRDGGGVTIEALSLSGGQLQLTGSAATSTDWFLDELHLKGEIADPAGGRVLLPVAGADTEVAGATLAVDFGGATEDWHGDIAVRGFKNAGLAAETLSIKGSGAAANLADPATRRLTFNIDGALNGVTAPDPDVAAALGDSLGFGAAGLWNAGQPIELAQLRLAGKAVTLEAAGSIDKAVFNGRLGLSAASLKPFAGLAGRDLNGALDVTAKGTISPLIGGFDLDVDGTGTDLRLGEPAADRLLAGTVKLTGGIARTAEGVSARQFRLGNAQVQLVADGDFASTAADFRLEGTLADLKLVSPQASGAATIVATAKGDDSRIALDLAAKVPAGTLVGRQLSAATIGFKGDLVEGALNGALDGTANLGGQIVSLTSALKAAEGVNQMSGLKFSAGGTQVTGDLTQRQDGLFEGQLALASTDLSTAAALALVEAHGSANASIALKVAAGKQTAEVVATARDVRAGDIAVGSADIKAGIADLFGVPMVNGTVAASGIVAAGVEVTTLNGTAQWTGESTGFDATARLKAGTDIAVAGALAPLAGGYRLALDEASLTQGKLSATLAAPAVLTMAGDRVTLGDVRFNVGGGSITASGSAAEALDIAVVLKALPLSVANAVAPGLDLAGTINGTARMGGSRSSPTARFELSGAGIGAAALKDLGVTPLSLAASGSFAANTLTLASASAKSPAGLELAARGTVPLGGRGLAIEVNGSAPLALANRFVADRGGQASGTARLSAQVSGSLSAPQFAGKVTLNDGSYIDPPLSLRLVGITGSATLAGDRLSIDKLAANIATGGSISASGTVALRGGFDTDLKLNLNHARYVDQSLLVATLSGNLALTGPLTGGPLLAGNIAIEKADISVPSQLGGGVADINVRHVATPKAVAASLKRGRVELSGKPSPAASAASPRLSLDVAAPNQVFIRGRGLDVEMGGSVHLGGRFDDIQPVGGLHLVRGRMSILGQRISFNSGTVTLTGNLDPEIALAAEIPGDDITVVVNVSGRASNPKVDFTSAPALPQDEVLSRLLFKQGVTDLSPLQLARLAGAASELAGGSGSSLLDSLRATTGLDDLELITDAKGNTAVQAGRYIDDNIYVGVQAGSDGKSKVTVNLDVTPDLKATAGTGSDGDSSVGLFFEQDY